MKHDRFFENSGLVELIARSIVGRWNNVRTHYDDLVGEGYLALWTEIDGYKQDSPYNFQSYCCRVISAAMYDYIRRTTRHRLRRLSSRTITFSQLGIDVEPSSDDGDATEMVDVGVTEEDLYQIARGNARITSPEISSFLKASIHQFRPDRDQLEGMLALGGKRCVQHVADDLGVHPVTVRAWMKRYGIRNPSRRVMPTNDQLADMLGRKPLREVARELGMPRETLRQWVIRHSILKEGVG